MSSAFLEAPSALALLLACLIVGVRALVFRDHLHKHIGDAGHGSVESCSKLINHGTHNTVELAVGTPPQRLDLVADTGNSFAPIVQSCTCKKAKNYFEECKDTEKCFDATKSSTYIAPEPLAPLIGISFGSGDIVVAPATDTVDVAQVSATMEKGLLMIVKRTFQTVYDFEGILGLGVPVLPESPIYLQAKNTSSGSGVRLPGFLEVAKVSAFSMCFNPGQDGSLVLNPAAMPRMMKQIGRKHWSLSLMGFAVGSASAPITVCNPQLKESGAVSPCAAIPDSGSTHIMGPKKDIDQILADACSQWPRCQQFKQDQQVSSTKAFRSVLWDCQSWMTPEVGISEVPSLFVHVEGSEGEKEVLEITAMSYVYQSTSAIGNPVCLPSLEEFKHSGLLSSKAHGTAWIIGTPLFYEYQVAHGLSPASIGFSKTPCKHCGDETTSLILHKGLTGNKHVPRIMNGEPRMPSIDVDDEL